MASETGVEPITFVQAVTHTVDIYLFEFTTLGHGLETTRDA